MEGWKGFGTGVALEDCFAGCWEGWGGHGIFLGRLEFGWMHLRVKYTRGENGANARSHGTIEVKILKKTLLN